MDFNFDNKAPIYLQILNRIKKDILTGQVKSGEKLSSMRDMADRFKVNPNTIQRVYQILEAENITYTQRGMGTFITSDKTLINKLKKEMANSQIESFVKEMKGLKFTDPEIIEIVQEYLSKHTALGG